MDAISEQKDALAAIGLASLGMILLIATTQSYEYGLPLSHDTRWIWTLTRIFPAAAWMSIAAILVLVRGAVYWSSAATGFLVALTVACGVAAMGSPPDANAVSIMTSVSYYAIISALLCLTFRHPVLAGLASLAFLFLQVLTDVAAHLATGVIQIAL